MIVSSLSAFSQKHSPFEVWNAIALSCFFAGTAVWLLTPDTTDDVGLFLSGIVPSWLLGLLAFNRLLKGQRFADAPFLYRAFAETKPGWSFALFLSFLGMVGFPVTPAFLGEDLILSHASNHHPWFALPITICFVINGIAAARMFLRLCMGRPETVQTETAH